MTDSESETGFKPGRNCNPLDCLRKIGRYELETLSGDKHTEGGFCRVYRAQYKTRSSEKQAAIKVSLRAVEDCETDIKWIAYKREWKMFQSLAFGRSKDSQSSGIPAVYECGFVQTEEGTHSWMSMQLLGADLRKLAWKGKPPTQTVTPTTTHFITYATGMLAALQHVHEQRIVHNDVKPANFCLAAGSIQASSKVYIVDFGLAVTAPNREQALQDSMYMYANFQGTPDYASKDALNGLRCSAKDDLESLGYAFLEMLTGDLLWDLVANMPYGDGDYFSQEQLISMADTRDQAWEEACKKGEIPTFLINWKRYVRSLKAFDTPSYVWLHHLIHRSQDKAAAQRLTKRPRDSVAEEEPITPRAKHLKVEQSVAREERFVACEE